MSDMLSDLSNEYEEYNEYKKYNGQRSKYLRQILNRMDISYKIDDNSTEKLTIWKKDESIFYYRETEYRDKFVISKAVPGQAVAATLESGTCKLLPYSENYYICSNCGSAIPKKHGGWWLYCPGCGQKLVIV